MNFLKSFVKSKTNIILLVILVIGIVVAVLPFLITAEQCPSNYTPKEGDNCIIGADIGSGMIFILGILIVAAAMIGLCISVISAISSKSGKFSLSILLIGLSLLGYGLIMAPLLNETEINNKYGCYVPGREIIDADKYCQNPRGAPDAQRQYKNTPVVTGAALLLAGSLGGVATIIKQGRK